MSGEREGLLVHNYSRDLWPEKQFINHSAWANVLQIVLHAAAILVCVKRHNKPGHWTCLGGGGAEENWRLWVEARKSWKCFEQRHRKAKKCPQHAKTIL